MDQLATVLIEREGGAQWCRSCEWSFHIHALMVLMHEYENWIVLSVNTMQHCLFSSYPINIYPSPEDKPDLIPRNKQRGC